MKDSRTDRPTRAAQEGIVRRFATYDEIRAEGEPGEKRKIVGHAAVFDRETVIGGWLPFREVIRAGAFDRVIAEDHDVRSLINHDRNLLLGRTKSKTLLLKTDDRGLWTETDPPDTGYARDLVELIDRGDLDGMSFAFRVTKERWTFDDEDPENDLREILEVEMRDGDISPVTFPAYPQTDVGMRSQDEEAASQYHKNARSAALGDDGQEAAAADCADKAEQELAFARAQSESAAIAAGINPRERTDQ